jgi:uncharacterized phage protein (TIGR01671 family)
VSEFNRGKAKLSIEELNEIGVPHANGWVFGYLVEDFITGAVLEATDEYVALEWWAKVDPAAIGRYIGIKDKHGNEVYSDHILSYRPITYTDCSQTEIKEIGEESLISIVAHRPIATVIKPHTKNVRCFGWDNETGEGLILNLDSEEIEIVGSIHENPELLEGGKAE